MSPLREKFDRINTIREMFPKCAYCGFSIRATPIGDLLLVADRDRLAHRDCLAAEAEETDAA